MKSTLLGISFLSIAAIMLIPAYSDSTTGGLMMYGIVDVTVFDADGNEVLQNTVHNRIMDEGEDFLIEQVFKEGNAGETLDNDQIGSICLSKHADFNGNTPTGANEGDAATLFDTESALTTQNYCQTDAAVDISGTSTAVVSAVLTYTANLANAGSHVITNIGICQGDGNSVTTAFSKCQDAQASNGGIIFAQIDIADFTLAAGGEQATISYTFDISANDAP